MDTTVALTIGPRGAGKSKFCESLATQNPHIHYISRDAILIRLFGATSLNPYEGGHYFVQMLLSRILRRRLRHPGTIILDSWNGFPRERVSICRDLRDFGAKQIIGWYFKIPLEKNLEWFLAKMKSEHKDLEIDDWRLGMWRTGCENDHELFYAQPVTLDQGFDRIVEIDPLNPPSTIEELF